MSHVTCRLTAKKRDQLRNPTLGNQVWATLAMSWWWWWWSAMLFVYSVFRAVSSAAEYHHPVCFISSVSAKYSHRRRLWQSHWALSTRHCNHLSTTAQEIVTHLLRLHCDSRLPELYHFYALNKLSSRGRRNDMPPADCSSTRGGSTASADGSTVRTSLLAAGG